MIGKDAYIGNAPVDIDLRPPTNIHVGTVTRAPATISDGVMVELPGLVSGYEYGPCPWQPRVYGSADGLGALQFPAVGDFAVVEFSDDQLPYVSLWTTTRTAVVPSAGGGGGDVDGGSAYSTYLPSDDYDGGTA